MAISLAFIRIIIVTMMDYIPMLINQNLSALRHRLTYKLLPSTLNVLVIGGSYTGIHLAKRLAESLPTGYKVVLVERKSHFNHLFNFPRYSVVKGREERAFIPYDGVGKSMAIPQGILEHVTGTVTKIKDTEVELANGDTIPFSYLAICTGATLPPPATLTSLGKKESCAELQNMQNEVEGAKKIAIVGGGAVGVQIAGDIKSFYPQKDVTLVHSRPRLLNAFGETLGEFVVGKLEAMGVRVVLGERPQWLKGGKELTFKDGQTESFDLVIPCTGQKPNTSLIATAFPDSISPTTNRIVVTPTLQLAASSSPVSTGGKPGPAHSGNIFALGDVADTPGPKMARAGMMQAEVARGNICALINGQSPASLMPYVPMAMEGHLALSLGRDGSVMYMQQEDGSEVLQPGRGKGLDLEVGMMWWRLGAKMDIKESNAKM